METKGIVIDAKEIRKIYDEFFAKEPRYVNDGKFKEFLKFLKIDFYDWLKENLRQFESN